MTAPDGAALLAKLRRRYASEADVTKAKQMQQYMKSALPYHGVKLPLARSIAKELFEGVELLDFEAFAALVRALWHGAKYREERYAVLTLLDLKATRRFHVLEALPLYEELIRTGAWWDLVDELASHHLGALLEQEPAALEKVFRRWSRLALDRDARDRDPALWLRRSTIIAQIFRREDTDVALLFDVIEPSVGEKEFFLRKAIGWALRALAPHRPAEVRRWLAAHADSVSTLSRKEAEKGLARAKTK